MSRQSRVSLVFASSSMVFLVGSAFAQMEGVCFIDIREAGSPCVCMSDAEFDAFRPDAAVKLCELPKSEDQQLSRLSPDVIIPDVIVEEEIPPIINHQGKVWKNNGIGNGLQAAPGNSDITNGDFADGQGSGDGPEDADGNAANGDDAGASNNGNGGQNNKNKS